MMKVFEGFYRMICSSFIKTSWILLVAILLMVICSCTESKSLERPDDLTDNQIIETFFPKYYFDEDLNLMERASPRFGRASPRFGRAAPRFGRRAAGLLSRLNHAGRYYDDDDSIVDDASDGNDSWMNEKRAAPRLGRSV